MTLWTGALTMWLFGCATRVGVSAADQPRRMSPAVPVEGTLESFLGEPEFEMQQIFTGERFPNVAVALDGTVVATWGRDVLRARRSEDGGRTWGAEIPIAEPGFHGGGLTVDEATGDLLAFAQDGHPPSPAHMHRSTDHGKTWLQEELNIEEDIHGHLPQVHMAEHGITLRHGSHKNRLLRAARFYGNSDGYNTAIYSDDGGKTWLNSKPFPMLGTGEGAIVELSNGRIYYTSRKHWFKDVADFTSHRSFAWSDDGGETWDDAGFDSELPDGPRYRGEKRRGACYNNHFGMMCGLDRLPVERRDILIYSNADTPEHRRVRMTVWASFDGGKTWPVKRLVHEGPSAYSSLSAGRPGTPSEGWLYLQFEGGETRAYEGAYLARFNLSWLLDGEKTGDGELPTWIETNQ
jgi:sialidase-1